MGMYYFFMFGIFSNIYFNALLAWLDILLSSQAAACAKPGSELPLIVPMLLGKSSMLSVITTSRGKTTKPPFTSLKGNAESEMARHFELKKCRMQLWVYLSIISMDLGGKASQVLPAAVAKGIFGAGGNSDGGVQGCHLWGTGICAMYSKAAPSSWLCFISQKSKILKMFNVKACFQGWEQ